MLSTWNWLDWTLVGILLASIVTAWMKGFFQELISLASVVVGLAVAAWGYPWAATWFEDMTSSRDLALGAGFLSLFLLTLIAGALISLLVRRLIKTAGIQWFDRLLGGAFGLVRGLVIDCILLLAMVAFAIKPNAVQNSALAPYVVTGTRAMALLMPKSLRMQFRGGFEKFRQVLIQTDRVTLKNK